ncbi:MAG: hypothetical protein GX335_07530 [Firmicutes bacterium]|nr:hypothetical protein [Bacillota bacterium]
MEKIRSGYLPQQSSVVSINALEWGFDIGTLQTAVLTGYPGSIAALGSSRGGPGQLTLLSGFGS